MRLKKFEQLVHKMTIERWGGLLLVALPITNAFIYWIYVGKLDIEWFHYSRLIQLYSPEMTQQILSKLLEHGALFHWAKLSLWIVVLCFIKLLLIGIFSIAFAQFFNSSIKGTRLFLISLWSQVTLVFGMTLSLVRLLNAESPMRIYLKDLDPSSWNSILKINGDGALQFFTSYNGPIVFVNIFILAYLFKHQTNLIERGTTSQTGWAKSISFALLPYAIVLGVEYCILGIVLSK